MFISRLFSSEGYKKMNDKKILKKFIHEVLSAADAQSQYGKILFGSDRGGEEFDTDIEKKLAGSLKSWFDGNLMSMDQSRVKELIDLERTDLYDDVLKTPTSIKTVHRLIKLRDEKSYRYFAGKKILSNEIRSLTDREASFLDSGIIEISAVRPGASLSIESAAGPSVKVASWSASESSLLGIHKQWFLKSASGFAYLEASASENRGAFLLNPDETRFLTPYPEQYEIFQVAPVVKLSGGIAAWVSHEKAANDTDFYGAREMLDEIVMKAVGSRIATRLGL